MKVLLSLLVVLSCAAVGETLECHDESTYGYLLIIRKDGKVATILQEACFIDGQRECWWADLIHERATVQREGNKMTVMSADQDELDWLDSENKEKCFMYKPVARAFKLNKNGQGYQGTVEEIIEAEVNPKKQNCQAPAREVRGKSITCVPY